MTEIKNNDLVILRKKYQECSVLHENQAFLCDLKRAFFSLSFMSAPYFRCADDILGLADVTKLPDWARDKIREQEQHQPRKELEDE